MYLYMTIAWPLIRHRNMGKKYDIHIRIYKVELPYGILSDVDICWTGYGMFLIQDIHTILTNWSLLRIT